MRCISPHANYSIQVIEGNEQIVMDARGFASSHVLAKPVSADFEVMGLLDHEIEAALERFSFRGLPEGVNPLTTVSCFDTEAYVLRFPKDQRSAMLVQINHALKEKQQLFPSDFIIVSSPQAPRPWPSYDEDNAEEILSFRERLRVDPTEIRLYEEQHKKRVEVINAMWDLEDPERAERVASGQVPENEVPKVEEFEVGA